MIERRSPTTGELSHRLLNDEPPATVPRSLQSCYHRCPPISYRAPRPGLGTTDVQGAGSLSFEGTMSRLLSRSSSRSGARWLAEVGPTVVILGAIWVKLIQISLMLPSVSWA